MLLIFPYDLIQILMILNNLVLCEQYYFNLLQTVFASYSDRAVHFMELPGEIPNRQVLLFMVVIDVLINNSSSLLSEKHLLLLLFAFPISLTPMAAFTN